MGNGADETVEPIRLLYLGYPGSGKTGSLAALANAGFKLRILDFDGNLEPLRAYTDAAHKKNLDWLTFEDATVVGRHGYQEVQGIPEAFNNALRAMIEWKDGDRNLGRSKDWGPDTIVVLDSMTSMGQAAKWKIIKMQNKNPETVSDRVWGLAMQEQEEFIKNLTSSSNRYHTIVLSHLVMVGPREVRKGDDDITQAIKKDIAQIVPTRLYPSALGWKLPQTIAGEFPTTILAEQGTVMNRVTRTIHTLPRENVDLKVPSPLVEAKYNIADGMLKIFQALSPESVALVQGAK